MPFSFRIDEDDDLLSIRAEGLLTPELLCDCVAGYVSHDSFRPGLDVLILLGDGASAEHDGRELSPFVLVKEDVLKEARSVLDPGRRCVPHRVVCAGGSSKMRTIAIAAVGMMDGETEIAAFKETPAALNWLGKEK